MEQYINNAPFALVIVFLIIGFVFLIKGADFFVEGSSSIAKKLKVPSIIIGLTIVAMGTSLPETAVSVTASLVHNNELAVSNVVGSNIFNLMFGDRCLCDNDTDHGAEGYDREGYPAFCYLCAAPSGTWISCMGDAHGMTLGHLDGAVFLGAFAGYIFYMIRTAMKARAEGKKS